MNIYNMYMWSRYINFGVNKDTNCWKVIIQVGIQWPRLFETCLLLNAVTQTSFLVTWQAMGNGK